MKKMFAMIAVLAIILMTGTAFARIIDYHYYSGGVWNPMTVDPISDATEVASSWASSCFASGPSGTYRYHTTGSAPNFVWVKTLINSTYYTDMNSAHLSTSGNQYRFHGIRSDGGADYVWGDGDGNKAETWPAASNMVGCAYSDWNSYAAEYLDENGNAWKTWWTGSAWTNIPNGVGGYISVGAGDRNGDNGWAQSFCSGTVPGTDYIYNETPYSAGTMTYIDMDFSCETDNSHTWGLTTDRIDLNWQSGYSTALMGNFSAIAGWGANTCFASGTGGTFQINWNGSISNGVNNIMYSALATGEYGGNDTDTGARFFGINPIPEPGLIIGGVALGLLAFRRRK